MRQHAQNVTNQGTGPGSPHAGAIRLHLDAHRGIAGDMVLAALFDLGIPPESVLGPLRAVLPPFHATVIPVSRRSIRALSFRVESGEEEPPRRGIREIESLLDTPDLPSRAVDRARRTFRLLAEAEGAVHGISPEEVHFHEIGAIDSLVDVIGVCLAIERLDPVEITCSSIPLGSGTVSTAHGLLAVPAPAVLRILEGVPVHPFPVGREVTTPTGAALAVVLADRFCAGVNGRLIGSGSGAGSRESAPDEPPNVLRVWTTDAGRSALEEVVLLETNLDTASGEDAGDWIDALLAEGALDAWVVPTIQKKGRPGLLLSVLGHPGEDERLRRAMFRWTGTLGVRSRTLAREALPREVTEATLRGHPVRIKRAWLDGELLSERPEHEDLLRIARETGRPLRVVRAEIEAELARLREGDSR